MLPHPFDMTKTKTKNQGIKQGPKKATPTFKKSQKAGKRAPTRCDIPECLLLPLFMEDVHLETWKHLSEGLVSRPHWRLPRIPMGSPSMRFHRFGNSGSDVSLEKRLGGISIK